MLGSVDNCGAWGIDGAIVSFWQIVLSPLCTYVTTISCYTSKRILSLLLPVDNSNLKASSKTFGELREQSGYDEGQSSSSKPCDAWNGFETYIAFERKR